jgi:hypothetical protein
MTAIDGRTAIAQALSGICGAPVSVHQLDRLETRAVHPLPLHGYQGRKWAFLDELQTWWSEELTAAAVATATRRMDRQRRKPVKHARGSRASRGSA